MAKTNKYIKAKKFLKMRLNQIDKWLDRDMACGARGGGKPVSSIIDAAYIVGQRDLIIELLHSKHSKYFRGYNND